MIAAREPVERTQDLVRAIRSLIEIAFDGEQGYDDAALVASSPETRAMLAELAEERGDFVTALERVLVRMNAPAEPPLGSARAALHRGWVELRTALSRRDDVALLEECLRGDAAALKSYRRVLAHAPLEGRPELEAELRAQCARIEEARASVELAIERARAERHDGSPASLALDFIRRRHCMTLATNGADGPWAASVMYVSDGFDLFFASKESARHVRDLSADARVAVAINEDCATWSEIKGVQLEGRAERVAGAAERAKVFARLLARHPSTRAALGGEAADLANDAALLVFRIAPARVLYLDNRALPRGRVAINLPSRGSRTSDTF